MDSLIYKRNKLLSLELFIERYYKKYVSAVNNHEREQGGVMVSYLSRDKVGEMYLFFFKSPDFHTLVTQKEFQRLEY